ncbi:hypothetical protein HY025_01115 [Candidatus Daviesbacteria bacterium]|nr:hypothetical protein [Candidatus Daviesbacteria bacterium]
MNLKNLGKKTVVTGLMALSMLVGAAGGASIFNAISASAQTVTTTPVVNTQSPNSGGSMSNAPALNGKFKPNEDPAHEAGESKEREAQEDAGQFPTVK